jgi:hypothetical protein
VRTSNPVLSSLHLLTKIRPPFLLAKKEGKNEKEQQKKQVCEGEIFTKEVRPAFFLRTL